MVLILSLVTSIKDYLEVVHKFVEYDSVNLNYTELGSILTFILISIKNSIVDFFSFTWLLKENLWSLPIIIPEISSAMISEISVLDGYFHNAFNFLDTPISYGVSNISFNDFISCLEKFVIGLINSFFLFLPTSTAHIITLRRFVMQGLDAGYISGLGTIAGNIFWLGSIILGCRFFVIPWLSLDIFRYVLGFILLIKYMWDSYNEKKTVTGTDFYKKGQQEKTSFLSGLNFLTDNNNKKIFLLNFLLALTEQTSIYPFISNISINPEISMLETFPLNADFSLSNSSGIFFIGIHCSYLLGITVGSLSLLHLSCWFWENPAFKFYMWVISYSKVSTSFYYKILNFTFLYLTMLSAICSIPYYGLDYTITNPLGYVNDDRIIQDKLVLETSFLGTKASDRNTRRNRGRHGRRERWKRRIRKYRTFDASLYDQGIYDLFTIEDLNYGFDRFWLRRKLRNHRVRFRFFPGPWMRSFKKQLAKPRLESYTGPRIEFFRILFEQVYHPSFHAYNNKNSSFSKNSKNLNNNNLITSSEYTIIPLSNSINIRNKNENLDGGTSINKNSIYINNISNIANSSLMEQNTEKFTDNLFLKVSPQTNVLKQKEQNFIKDNENNQEKIKKSIIRKFIRKFDNRVKILNHINSNSDNFERMLDKKRFLFNYKFLNTNLQKKQSEFTKLVFLPDSRSKINNNGIIGLTKPKEKKSISVLDSLDEKEIKKSNNNLSNINHNFLKNSEISLNKKDLLILNYRSLLTKPSTFVFNQNNKQADIVLQNKLNSTARSNFVKNSENKNESLMLLHPLKFYLQQEAGFKRKLRYYTPNIYRKFSVENNAPFFRVMMKRYFYNYKPTLRWERTMKTASLRKARRKTTRIPRKLQKTNTNLNNTNINTLNLSENLETIDFSNTKNKINLKQIDSFLPIQLEKSSLQKSTYNYSVVSKRANRYRYQIYKDVLQHWYYSPFNRILLKLDVDSFIKRQPNTHFLTSKEENLLHLRRFLLSEHYNTLRWYTNMQHYRSMKTQLNGGTKSFSSRFYNQQFAGTFKKIRHLFSITPSVNPMCLIDETKLDSLEKGTTKPTNLKNTAICTSNKILKFDQPLYNEYYNSNKEPLLNPLIIHEELLSDFNNPINNNNNNNKLEINLDSKQKPNFTKIGSSNIMNFKNDLKTDLLSQSQNIVREYLIQTRSIRETYIKKLLEENNYTELTKFIYKGQKIRGEQPVTNQRLFNNQEKIYLLNDNDFANSFTLTTKEIEENKNQKFSTNFLSNKQIDSNSFNELNEFNKKDIKEDILKNQNLYITFLKKWKRNVNDQESLKNYLNRRLEKREKRKQKKEKQLLNKLQRLENWFKISHTENSVSDSNLKIVNSNIVNKEEINVNKLQTKSDDLLTTGLQKSILEGMFLLNKIDTKIVSLNEKNLWKILLLSKIKEKETINSQLNQQNSNKKFYIGLQDLTLRFNNLRQAKYIKISTNLKTSIQTTRNFIQKSNVSKNSLYNYDSNIDTKLKKNITNSKKIKIYYLIKNKLLDFNQIILSTAKTAKNQFLKLQKINNLLKPIQRKSLKDWRKKERVLSKQKRSRKEFKLLNKKSESISSYLDQNELQLALKEPSRKKRENNASNTFSNNDNDSQEKSLNFFNLFKRKRSPQRRSRVRRNRGVFKKRTLNEILRKDFLNFSNEKKSNSRFDFYKKFNDYLYSQNTLVTDNSKINTNLFYKDNSIKQRKSKQRKERFWKQKRSKYSQKRRKYRKRRRYTIVKIRTLNKQFKRFKNQIEIQNWWWKQFIPSIQASNEALWQIEKDKLIQQKLSQLSNSEILERDNLNNSIFNSLQLGNKDFKPLALPQTIRLNKFKDQDQDQKQDQKQDQYQTNILNSTNFNEIQSNLQVNNNNDNHNNFQIINKLYESLFINNFNFNNNLFTEFLVPNTNLPFYAGWDESLRKLIVTNRMLSRKEAGFNYRSPFLVQNQNNEKQNIGEFNNPNLEFSSAPLQGMNAATTLYWQIPFTTYDPDQFFALGMDGFSPIGWRKFLFRHSILKTWLMKKQTKSNDVNFTDDINQISNFNSLNFENKKSKGLIVTNQRNILKDFSLLSLNSSQFINLNLSSNKLISNETSLSFAQNKYKQNKTSFAISRRLKKRYGRVKKHPRTPVWFPSGPLLNQVLPVHYIYVFYKRARLPRDRYLKRRLINVKDLNNGKFINKLSAAGLENQNSFNYDFTLRKRLKPKRKYHLKRDYYASNVVIPRRFKFLSSSFSPSTSSDLNFKKWRPLSNLKIHKAISEVVKEQQLLRRSAQQKQRSSKQQQPNMRVKQLRRRVQRQILRSVWRYKPRSGGFVWPGDYLKLELVKVPKLQQPASMQNISSNLTNDKISKQKRKKKRTLVEWQLQPKKYLYEKHNLNVIKKKLLNSQRSFGSNTITLNILRNSI